MLILLPILCGGCVVHHDYEYFEPSGLDSVISRPARAPKNVGIKMLGSAELTVRSRVSPAGRIEVFLYLRMPPGSRVRFTSDRARILNGVEDTLTLSWREWTLRDGVGSKHPVRFDAHLKPQSFPKAPRRSGVEDMGQYECRFVLPAPYSDVQHFTLVLPAPEGGSPLRVAFTRKSANFLDLAAE